jgi:hypothetical protein
VQASDILPFDPSARVVLPVSAAVKAPRFSPSRHWSNSQIVREVLDSFAHTPLRPAPRVVADHNSESIVMEGVEIRRTMRTGSHVVRQNSTAALDVDHTPAPLAFEVVADTTLASEAAAALDRLATQTVRARRRAVPAPSADRSHVAWFAIVMLVISLGALALAAWH